MLSSRSRHCGAPDEEDQNGVFVGFSYESDDRTQCFYPGAGTVANFAFDELDQPARVETTRLRVETAFLGRCIAPISRASFPGGGVVPLLLEIQQQLDANKLVRSTNVVAPLSLAPERLIGRQTLTRNRNNGIDGQEHQRFCVP